MKHPQVLISGAGPVGLTMALALARQNIPVRIVDKNARRTDKSKALVLWPRTLELLDIQGCAQPFVDAGLKVRDARIVSDDKQLVHLSFEVARSIYSYALMLPQSETELLLEEQLSGLGVVVERNTELTFFTDHGETISADLRGPDGLEETVTAQWLVGCDGAHSTVRHGLESATFEGETLPSNWVLADVVIGGAGMPEEITICFSHHGLLVFFPIGNQRFRVIAETGTATSDSQTDLTMADVQSLVDARGPSNLRLSDPIWLSRFRINERKVRDYQFGRVFLAGDAAHVHSPAGGQGMNTGMQDAMNLAWKLAMVCSGDAHVDLLASYSPERSAIGEQVLSNAARLTKVGLVKNPILQTLRSLAAGVIDHLPSIKQRFVDQMTEVDLHYANSPLTQSPQGASQRPAGGERAPDVALTGTGPQRLHTVLGTGRFAVLSVGVPIIELSCVLERIAVAVNVNSSASYESGYVYLVRPDAYVALSTRHENTCIITSTLHAIATTTRISSGCLVNYAASKHILGDVL